MGDRLRVNTTELIEAGHGLRRVAVEFHGADAHSRDVAANVGHHGLAGCVEDFATGWNDRRAKMVKEIEGLAEACTGIGEGFERLDSEFAKALKGES